MKIPLHTLLSDVGEMRSIFATEKSEIRYFKVRGEDSTRDLRVTGTKDGGLRIEEMEDGKWQINSTAAPKLGDSVTEVSKSE